MHQPLRTSRGCGRETAFHFSDFVSGNPSQYKQFRTKYANFSLFLISSVRRLLGEARAEVRYVYRWMPYVLLPEWAALLLKRELIVYIRLEEVYICAVQNALENTMLLEMHSRLMPG